jgi:hypothetical protein
MARDLTIPDRRDEPGRIDGQKLRVILDAGQQVHRPELIREPHLLQQPDDPESSSFAENGDHVSDSSLRCW